MTENEIKLILPHGVVPIREIKVGKTSVTSLNIEDLNLRRVATKFAEDYIDKNWKEEEKMTHWQFYLLYFFLGAFVWEFIPVFTSLGINIWNWIK